MKQLTSFCMKPLVHQQPAASSSPTASGAKDPSTIRFTDDSGGTQVLKTSGSIVATGSRANRLPMVPFDLPGGALGPWVFAGEWIMVDGCHDVS